MGPRAKKCKICTRSNEWSICCARTHLSCHECGHEPATELMALAGVSVLHSKQPHIRALIAPSLPLAQPSHLAGLEERTKHGSLHPKSAAWLSLGLSKSSGVQKRWSPGGKAHRLHKQYRSWKAATSLLLQEASPGSRSTWHLVTVITAEL